MLLVFETVFSVLIVSRIKCIGGCGQKEVGGRRVGSQMLIILTQTAVLRIFSM